ALWITAEGGLSRLRNGRFVTLRASDGLPCDTLHWAIEDEPHALWMDSACGLLRVPRVELDRAIAAVETRQRDGSTVHAAVFSNSDGVLSTSTVGDYGPHVARSADGRLWFSSSAGVSVVDPRHPQTNTLPPPVHVERLTANHAAYDVTASDRVGLPPRVRDLQVDYTALSLVNPDKVLFRYTLEGYDRDWQDAGTRRQAFYTNLPRGSYRFRVTASNNSGVWNEAGAAVAFVIAPAYYQTTWFLALSIAAVVGAVWTAHRVRLRIVERHEREISALN